VRRPGPRGLTAVISDLLTPDWEAGIERLPSRGGDLVVIHVLDPEELHPTLLGDIELVVQEVAGGAIRSVGIELEPEQRRARQIDPRRIRESLSGLAARLRAILPQRRKRA